MVPGVGHPLRGVHRPRSSPVAHRVAGPARARDRSAPSWPPSPATHGSWRRWSAAAPILLMGGGVFLVLLFLHWLFLEPKQFGLAGEKFFASQGAWFFAVAAVFLALTVWFSLRVGSMVAFSAVIGSTLFFITHGFKENAEAQEKRLLLGEPFRPQQDPLPRDHRHDILHRRRARCLCLHPFGPPHHPGQRPGGGRRAADHRREHRAHQAASLHQERRHVLDPFPRRRHDVRRPRSAHPAVGLTGCHLRHRWSVFCEVGVGASKRGETEGTVRLAKGRRSERAEGYFFSREASYSSFSTRWSRASSSTVRDFSLMPSREGRTVWV